MCLFCRNGAIAPGSVRAALPGRLTRPVVASIDHVKNRALKLQTQLAGIFVNDWESKPQSQMNQGVKPYCLIIGSEALAPPGTGPTDTPSSSG